MIHIEPAPDHVLAVRAAGKLTKDDIKAFVAALEDRLSRHEKIGLVSDVTELDGMTFEAVFEDLRAELKYLGSWDRFPKLAVIAGEGFMRTATETVGRFVPQVQMRVFSPGEREEALSFAGKAGAAAPRPA